MNCHPSPQQVKFVEEVGLRFEAGGLPRMSGRIFGWLLICEPAQQSHTELAEILQASKGSISTMTRLLLQLQLIERIHLPGDRRDFFQIKPGVWRETCNYFLRQVTAFREVAQHGLEIMRDAAPPQKERLQEMHDIHAFWERELPRLNAQWEAERSPCATGSEVPPRFRGAANNH